MSIFVSLVNQKQGYAELLLHQAEQVPGQRHLQQALLQGAILQLRLAYRFYLSEIGATYKCREPASIADLWALIANLQLQGKNPVETSEIYNLEQQGSSWLCRLHDCCRALESVPDVGEVQTSDPERIPAFSSSRREDWSTLSCQQVGSWIQAFAALVERQRQAMLEC